jgi:organic hydroperoxide reductase OsmC/OhrA
MTKALLDESVKEAELTCPVSRALNMEITAAATLKNNAAPF